MSRTTASTGGGVELNLEDDAPYLGVLVSAAIEKSKNPAYPDDRLKVVWEAKQGATVFDWLSIKLGEMPGGGYAKLRQLLNALAEKPKDAEVWFDAATLEWGYDMAAGSPAFAVLTPGMAVTFRGENGKNAKGDKVYRIKSYRPAK